MKHLSAFLFLFYISTHIPAQTSDIYFARALAADIKGHYEEALELINKAIELDSSSSINYVFRASVLTGENNINRLKEYYTEENYNKAIEDLEMALKLYPHDELDIQSLKAKILMNFEEFEAAEALLDKIADPRANDYSRIYYFIVRAQLRYRQNNIDACFENMDRALEIDTSSHATLNQMAIYYLMEKERKLAIPIINKILSEDPDNQAALVNMAYSALLYGKYEKTIEWSGDLIETYPHIGLLYNNRGAAYFYMNNYDLALKDINKSLELSPANAQSYINRSKVYLALNKQQEACSDLELAKKYKSTLSKTEELYELMIDHCFETNKRPAKVRED